MTQSPLPLTTVFTPLASCTPTSYMLYAPQDPLILVFPDRVQAAGLVRSECFPFGFHPASPFTPAPFSCPVGYTVACQTTTGGVTSAVCCPSGWPCAGCSWGKIATYNFPCIGNGQLPFAYTGWVQTSTSSPDFVTTTFEATSEAALGGNFQSEAIGIFIDWRSSDLLAGVKHEPTVSTTSTPRSSSAAGSQSTSSSNASSAHSGLEVGAKTGIGIGVALAVLFAMGLAVFFVRSRRKTLAASKTNENIDEKALPAELGSKLDRPELEGDRGVELWAGSEKRDMQKEAPDRNEA